MNRPHTDEAVQALLRAEVERQSHALCLIPSENHASKAVRDACSSVLMDKYSEGYPGRRYYQGNANVDAIESLAIARAKELFGAEHVNVQSYSGSTANGAVYLAFLKPGDTVLGLALDSGGHLTHGSPVNFSGLTYHAVTYEVDAQTDLLDMAKVREIALREKPKLIISGATAYPRVFDFRAFQEIAEEVGALHLADISHIAGLVAAGAHPSPFPFTDIVMTTTHKTLRGPRGAIICCKQVHAKALDKAVFPGIQGGPQNHTTAAKAICFGEALTPEFKTYGGQIVRNARALGRGLTSGGVTLVSGGTDNHLLLIDLRPFGIGQGRAVAAALESVGVVTNANTVPRDPSTPFQPSGVRIGTPAITTRGFLEADSEKLGKIMATVICDPTNETVLQHARTQISALSAAHPLIP